MGQRFTQSVKAWLLADQRWLCSSSAASKSHQCSNVVMLSGIASIQSIHLQKPSGSFPACPAFLLFNLHILTLYITFPSLSAKAKMLSQSLKFLSEDYENRGGTFLSVERREQIHLLPRPLPSCLRRDVSWRLS